MVQKQPAKKHFVSLAWLEKWCEKNKFVGHVVSNVQNIKEGKNKGGLKWDWYSRGHSVSIYYLLKSAEKEAKR